MGGRVRPLLVSTAYPPSLGGAQLHAHQLMLALARAGHDPHVATIWQDTRSDWLRGTTVRAPIGHSVQSDVDGIPIDLVGVTGRVRGTAVLGTFYPALLSGIADTRMRRTATSLFERSIEDVTDRIRPDVIMLTRIGRAHLYAAAMTVARRRGLPVVLTPNHHATWVRRRDRWWWDLYRQADAVLALSDAEASLLVAGGVDRHRIHRTTVGVVGTPAAERTATEPRVTFLGQAHPYKGIDLLAEAWPGVRAAIPDARLDVVGPWSRGQRGLRDRLTRMPGVTVHGAVDEGTKWRVLAATHVVAVPSAAEALGGVYLEAWAAGAVPLGADIPAVRELIGTAGRVVPRRADALTGALVDLLADDASRDLMVARGRERLRLEHDWDRIAARTAQILHAASRASTSPSPWTSDA